MSTEPSEFQATAVDVSEGMLENSKRLNPHVKHHVGDMRTVRLGRTFKAVIIHDAITYMLTKDDLRATFETAKAHLRMTDAGSDAEKRPYLTHDNPLAH